MSHVLRGLAVRSPNFAFTLTSCAAQSAGCTLHAAGLQAVLQSWSRSREQCKSTRAVTPTDSQCPAATPGSLLLVLDEPRQVELDFRDVGDFVAVGLALQLSYLRGAGGEEKAARARRSTVSCRRWRAGAMNGCAGTARKHGGAASERASARASAAPSP